MKKYLEIVINLLLLLIILYLPFAFIINKYNPLGWEWYERSLYVLSVIAMVTYGVQEYKKK